MVYPYTEEQFKKIYASLPEDIKEIIFSEEKSEAIYNIASANNALDFVIEMANLIEDVFVGFLNPQDFEKRLEKTGIEKTIAKKIAEEIDEKIFSRIRYGLTKLYAKKQETPKENKQTPQETRLEEKIVAAPQTKIIEKKDIYRESI